MRRLFATLLPFVLVAVPVAADDKDEIALQLELAKAKMAKVQAVGRTKPIPYADALKIAKKTGQAIFVTVGMNCKDVCAELRPFMLTSHETEIDGSKAPRAFIVIPTKLEKSGHIRLEWKRLPSADEVKAEVAKYKPLSMTTSDLHTLALGLVESLIAMPDGDYVVDVLPTPRVCTGPECQQGVQMFWGGNVSTSAGQFTYSAAMEGDAVARFPRLAAIRGRLGGRLRAAVGLPPPRVAMIRAIGGVSVAGASSTIVADAQGGPIVVGSGLFQHFETSRKLHRALGVLEKGNGVTPEQGALFAKVRSNPEAFSAFVSHFKTTYETSPGAIGKLGDGTILKMILDNLPQILAFVTDLLKLLHLA